MNASRWNRNALGFCGAVFAILLCIITVWALYSLNKEKKYAEELLELKDEMQNQADLDPLTMLYNKKVTEKLIRQEMYAMKKEQMGVFMIIDVDGFKSVNDTYGHPLGDKVLIELASRLKQAFRDTDIVGRIGGDEFCIFFRGNFGNEEIRSKAADISELFRDIQVQQREDIKISCSCGISVTTGREKTFEQIYLEADRALYAVKETGKNGYEFYTKAIKLGTHHHL